MDKHEHDGEFPIFRHSAFGPHGDGIQGFLTSGTGSSTDKKYEYENMY